MREGEARVVLLAITIIWCPFIGNIYCRGSDNGSEAGERQNWGMQEQWGGRRQRV